MRQFLRCLSALLLFIGIGTVITPALGQKTDTTAFDPNDPIRVYDPGSPPQEPAYGEVGKWVKSNRVNWNTSSYKAYIYKSMPFRLKYPKNWDRTKKYPLYVFFHGLGEYGSVYDNEYQLYHGGELHKNAVDNGNFDGFLLYPQNQTGPWRSTQITFVSQLIDLKLIPQLGIDPFRISVNGLSAGGAAAWDFTIKYTKLVGALLGISASTSFYLDSVNKYKWTPIWHFQGALDNSPTPVSSRNLGAQILAAGGNYRYTEYPNRGHSCWYDAWGEKDYFSFMMRAHKANPWALSGRTEFCAGDPVNATLGVTAGFDGYEWRKDGMLIAGATTNQIVVNSLGTYDCRIKRGTVWSVWSPTPMVLKIKTGTVPPAIQVSGVASNVLPAPDGSTSVQLEVPDAYVTYNWQKEGDATVLSTTRFLTASTPANYKVQVTEKYGCSSTFSNLFAVVNAAGQNSPPPISGLLAAAASKTSIQLNWSQHASPAYNETAFEVYQATVASGPYKLVQITPADVTGATIIELASNTKYFYKVRAVNGNGASDVVGPVSATTQTDNTAPTAPENLHVTFITRNSVDLLWNPSSDDVGVTKYDIYIDGVKTYVTENTSYSVYNLTQNKTYTFTIKARDFTGNTSPSSNQATATTIFTGLSYKYYEGVWNVLPDFNALTPVKRGTTRNIDLTYKNKADSFAFLWEGYIRIPVSGSYTFRTTSDDGSKLYIGTYTYGATALVNNDGLHGAQNVDGTISLNAGVYPIAISFFERTGDESMAMSWKTPSTGGNFVRIPDSVLAEAPVVNGQSPAKPSNLTATATSYRNINISWTDNSTDESGFEILRSENSASGFTAIKKTAANVTSYSDTLVNPATTYYYRVRAVNQYGESPFDKDGGNGVDYTYYENTGLSSLPDFNTISPVKVGRTGTFALGNENRSDNFEFKFDGFIKIPTTGTYTFYTTSDDGSKLYIGGYNDANLVVNNDGLHAPQEQSGTKVLNAGTYPITITFFESGGGEVLSASISGPGLNKQIIPSAMLGDPYVNATTQALPALPLAPANLLATAASAKAVNITWSDNATTEDAYELYRSSNTNTNYVLVNTLPANTTSYQDTGLFSNAVFYYKVKAVNVGGGVASNEDSAKTANNKPVVTVIENQYIKYGTQLQLAVMATDVDPEAVTLQATGLPSFATFTSGNNGKGTITFNPAVANQGTYTITITATDQNTGTDATTFQLLVSSNNNPVVAHANNISVAEKTTAQITLTATDADAADVLSWSFKGLPSFASVSAAGGSAQITFAPGYADANSYVIQARVKDNKNAFDTTSFTVTVSDVNVDKTYYVNFNSGSNATGVWNNLNIAPALGATVTGFKDARGVASTLGLKVTSDWAANGLAFSSGTTTGNNSGVYPDIVMKTGWQAGKIQQTFQLTGLDPTLRYNLTFFNSKYITTGDRTTTFTVNGTSVSLNALNNTTNTVAINRAQPANDGTITVNVKNASTSAYAYINAMVIESGYDDGSTPLLPQNLAGVFQNTIVKLSWKDVAYNETQYQIFRATAVNGTYSQIKSLPRDSVAYNDSTVQANRTYYYKIQAANPQGVSGFTDPISVVIPNIPPVLNTIADQLLKNDTTVTLNITAVDDPADVVKITGTNIPAFVTLTDNGNGTGSLYLAPAVNHVGVYKNVTITAADNNGGVTTKTFTITVSNRDVNTVLVNFNSVSAAPAPWNNFNSLPTAGKIVSNLKDDGGVATGINITLVDAWQTAGASGAVTGNNSGIYPDLVMKTYYYDTSKAVKRIQLSGLSASKRYNVSFFGSRSGTSGNLTTKYTAGGQTVSLNATGNTSNAVKINGLIPDASGKIDITVMRDDLSTTAFINAIVIQSYNSNVLLTPTNLGAVVTSRSGIRLSWVDNSADETGFEIWRSTSAGSSFTLVTTTAANTTAYTDGGLAENQWYYYKVRAKSATTFSSFSNVANASTLAYLVYENFNVDNPAAAPWNNTNSLPEQYAFFQNLDNDLSNPSGVSITIVNGFSGTNPLGMNTGNNSGVVPDNVMRASYYCDKGVVARLRIDGLSQVKKYNFIFFGSRNGSGDRTTLYTINGQTASLNAAFNTTQTTQLNSIAPDENGSIFIDITNGTASQFGYLNGMIIQGYNATPGSSGMGVSNSLTLNNRAGESLVQATNQRQRSIREDATEKSVVSVFPNPFTDAVTVQAPVRTKISLLSVKITDMSGRVISLRQFRNVPAGTWQQQISLKDLGLNIGTYFMQVDGLPGQNAQVVKILKIK